MQSFFKIKLFQEKVVHFMRLLIAHVMHHTSKKRSLEPDFAFVYIMHEWFRFPFLIHDLEDQHTKN
ncbi:hypothetical protein BAGA_16400 [Bacillus gaemokensis]|uniref:Transposase n=1 Tax=Bacillus gaemokensis TaxID=574375 RepID=A0A073K802_9BACI|nr:hypothetical protein BAGA_16400 [Bacillus gaemokensis]KYG36828.1 hypothetical protein AZF08_23920 [Bacillus gaemokensis]